MTKDTSLAHYDVLDGLRGIAASTVVLAHASVFPHPSAAGARWAVDLFFVLSGFLITRILLANRVTGQPAWKFWINRAARILPIYYLTVLVVWIVSRDTLAPWAAVYLSNYRYYLTHVHSALNHTWSLCVEEHFYLIWPLIVGAVPRRVSRLLVIVMIVGGAVSCIWLGEIAYVSVSSRVISLGAGSLFAFAEVWFARDYRRLAWVGVLMLALAALFYLTWDRCVGWISAAHPAYLGGVDTLFLLLTMASASSGVFALALWSQFGVVRRVLANRLLTGLGLISYGLYLFHYPIFTALHVFDPVPDRWRRAVIGVVVTGATAALSYHLIEMPIRRGAKRLLARRGEN